MITWAIVYLLVKSKPQGDLGLLLVVAMAFDLAIMACVCVAWRA